MRVPKSFNPFYALLLPAGFVFAITAFAYGYMAFQSVNTVRSATAADAQHPLYLWLRANGDQALLTELAVLAVLAVAAMATDRLWDRSKRQINQEP